MTILALDLSTETGWAVFDNKRKLVKYGTLKHKVEGKESPYNTVAESYPYNYTHAAKMIALLIDMIVSVYQPSVVVIEETNRGKSRLSQKLLEYIHYAVSEELLNRMPLQIVYMDTSRWRHIVGMCLTKEDKENNKLVKAGKKKEMKLKGKITKKHLSVRMVRELYNIDVKLCDNNACDAILLGHAYLRNKENAG